MSLIENNVKNLLPREWQERYPRLIQFVERYYEWMYRTEGLSRSEIELLLEDENWLKVDPDKFLDTGELRYMRTGDRRRDWLAVVQESSKLNPGAALQTMEAMVDMDQQFDGFLTADGELLEEADGNIQEARWDNGSMMRVWLRTLGFSDRVPEKEMGGFDPVLLCRCLKQIYEMKGSYECTKLFFNLFFGERVTVESPKDYIAEIDNNFVPDNKDSVIRDDVYFQEYAYVIWVEGDLNRYATLFNEIYLRHLHPSGFAVVLRKLGE